MCVCVCVCGFRAELLRHWTVINRRAKFRFVSLCDSQNHHFVLYRCAVEMVKCHVLGRRKNASVPQLRWLVQNYVPQVRGKGRRLLRVLVHVRANIAKYLIHHILGLATKRLDPKVGISLVRNKVAHVNEIVDPPLDVRNSLLIGRESELGERIWLGGSRGWG